MPARKYQPLSDFLKADKRDELNLSFAYIEKLLKDALPKSASSSQAWWSNRLSGGHQATAWLAAGYRVIRVDLNKRTVTFHRHHRQASNLKVPKSSGDISWSGAMVKDLRQHMRLTQSQFATVLGVRQQTISEWENEIYRPTRATSKLLTFVAEREKYMFV